MRFFSFVCDHALGGSTAAFRLVLASSSKVPLMLATSPATTATSQTQTEDIVGVWRRLDDLLGDFRPGSGSKQTYDYTYQQHMQRDVFVYIEQLRPGTYDERRWTDDVRVTMANGQPWNGLDLLNESHFPLHIDVPRTLPIAPVAMPP